MSSQPSGNVVLNGFRFSLSPTDPAPASDILGATTGYLVPFTSDAITLLNGSGALITDNTGGLSLSLSFSSFIAGTVHRIFASDPTAGGTITLSVMTWTSVTNPGTSLALTPATPGGFLVLASNHTLRYIADVYCVSTGAVDDAIKDRGVFNVDNRILRQCLAVDTTSSWSSGTTGAFRARNNNTTLGVGRFGVMIGLAQDAMPVTIHSRVDATASGNILYNAGFDMDGTTGANHSQEQTCDGQVRHQCSTFTWLPTVGWHFFQAVEIFGAGATFTVFGGGDFAQLEAIVQM